MLVNIPYMEHMGMGKPTKMDDLGVPLFQETSIWVLKTLNLRPSPVVSFRRNH